MFKLAWQKIIQSKESILKGGIVLFLGMNFVNFGNYLFNMIMGRTLGPSDYGGLVTLISFLAILGVPTATIQTSAMRFSAAFSAENHPDKINYLIKYLAKRMVLLGIILFAIVFGSLIFILFKNGNILFLLLVFGQGKESDIMFFSQILLLRQKAFPEYASGGCMFLLWTFQRI